MQKKQDTTTKYLDIKISSKEIFHLLEILKLYFLEQETLAYKNTSTSRPAYTFYRRTELEEYYKADLDMWESI